MAHFSSSRCPNCGNENIWIDEFTVDGVFVGLEVGCDTAACDFHLVKEMDG